MDLFRISKLGFGTSQIGGLSLINGRLIGAKPIPTNEAISILKYAYDNGINFFDTSDKYGKAEEFLGGTFYQIRNKVVIATKCGLTDTGGRNFSLPYINNCLENSLRRLATDYIDIFQLTKPQPQQITDELLNFFQRKIKEGKIRYFGISVIGEKDANTYLTKKIIQSFQIFYNLLFTENHELINKCAKKKRFVIIRSPLNSGMLSGKYTLKTKFGKVDSRAEIFRGELFRERLEAIERIKSYFNISSNEFLSFSLNFIFSNDEVNVVIPAASKLEQLKNYIRIFKEDKRFNKNEVQKILNFKKNEIRLKKSGQLK
jgi:aryl-alcohol dehydrogenase-like predicted oxidoreductase